MSTNTFTSEELIKLRSNPCVLKCTVKSVTFTHEFKVRAIEQHKQGVSSKEIWRRSGLDIWRQDYPRECMKRWRKIVKEKGYAGLSESSGTKATGRLKTKGVTDQDRIKRLELQVKYLKAENDFLAKLRARRAE